MPYTPSAQIGIIGGTGIYDAGIFENITTEKIHTPFGNTSDVVSIGEYSGIRVAFIPRHGKDHIYPPHKIPYKANIYAMKKLGVECIIAPMAVGSLKEEMRPGDLVFPDQFIDNTHTRDYTFFHGGQVAHISMAEPFCGRMRKILYDEAKSLNISSHYKGTYVCIEGPRFSTKAESNMYRMWGADVIGMTLVPEAQLAREMEMCYQPICMVTDYDVWKEDRTVTVEEVIRLMGDNVYNVKNLLKETIPKIAQNPKICDCAIALKNAIL